MNYQIQASTMFGLESVTADELKKLGYEDLTVENGKVTFEGDEMDIAIANVHLRTAERVLIKVAQFEAKTFDELFEKTKDVEWGEIIPIHGKMYVTGRSVKSTLFSVPDCQAIVKKAIIEAMKRKYGRNKTFAENGPMYKIDVALMKDVVTLTIDTTGDGLHKRGYREYAGPAPLKETLAAAMILLSRWKPDRQLVDPFCGSGTIPIEAAMIARNIAPGMNRKFVCEEWPQFKDGVCEQVREGARKQVNNEKFRILASDIDGHILKTARPNAKKAGVDDCIEFQALPANEFSSKKITGTIITNPPYGERMGEIEQIEAIYKDMGKLARKLPYWNMFIITSYEKFEDLFGEKASKNRKLYNGNLKCYLYQYIRKFTDKDREELEKEKQIKKDNKEKAEQAKEKVKKFTEDKTKNPFDKFIKKGRR